MIDSGNNSGGVVVGAQVLIGSLYIMRSNLMTLYCFTITATQYFANLIYKCKFVGVV